MTDAARLWLPLVFVAAGIAKFKLKVDKTYIWGGDMWFELGLLILVLIFAIYQIRDVRKDQRDRAEREQAEKDKQK